eukprot:14723423-Alexandrium_andersonii.AAC.1
MSAECMQLAKSFAKHGHGIVDVHCPLSMVLRCDVCECVQRWRMPRRIPIEGKDAESVEAHVEAAFIRAAPALE